MAPDNVGSWNSNVRVVVYGDKEERNDGSEKRIL
jgi:hypothetical protein